MLPTPYAQSMTSQAATTCHYLGLPYLRLLRPPWQQQAQDRWHQYHDLNQLLTDLSSYPRILLSLGQVDLEALNKLSGLEQVYLRTAVAPPYSVPDFVDWIKATGPFSEADEYTLLKRLDVAAVASKNSGGSSTYGKIIAARRLQLPVYMLQRPAIEHACQQQAVDTFADSQALIHHVQHKLLNQYQHQSFNEVTI